MQANLCRGWYDVKDQHGVWRLGKEINLTSMSKIGVDDTIQVRLEGWSHKYDSIYCPHSKNIAPPRTHTQGYTTQQPYPLRQIPTEEDLKYIQSLKVKLNLLLSSNLSKMNPADSNLFFRVELFTMFDQTLTLPFDVFDSIFSTNKFFINIVNLSIKVLKESSVYLPTVKTNPQHQALHKASYQIFLMLRGVVGLNNRYKKFFDHPDNYLTKSINNVECLLKSDEGGLLLFDTYLKNITNCGLNSYQDFLRVNQIIKILLQLFEKQLISQQFTVHLKIIVDSLAGYFRIVAKNKDVFKYLTEDPHGKYLINVFQNLHLKIKPQKKFIQLKEMKQKDDKREQLKKLPELDKQNSGNLGASFFPKQKQQKEDNRYNLLEQRLLKLEKEVATKKIVQAQPALNKLSSKKQQINLLNKLFQEKQKQIKKNPYIKATQAQYDFNQLSFLNAVQLHLLNNQNQKAAKLVAWRKKIIQLSMLAGWDVARSVANSTQHKLEVETEDILINNIDFLKQKYSI